MSEAQEVDTPIANSEEKIVNSNSTSVPAEHQTSTKSSNEEDPETTKSESIEEPIKCDASVEKGDTVPNDDTSRMNKSEKTIDDCKVENVEKTTSPTSINISSTNDRNKPGECNLLPVLVEQLRSALEQSCSSQSSSEETSLRHEDSGVDSEEDLRLWASGLCNSMEQQQKQQRLDDSQSPRGLKLDLKFLEDLLMSDIQTALGRLQETLQRVDIGTLARYSSSLDPTNKLNLLKLISSLLANLKIPEGSIVKPLNTAKSQATIVPRRRRTDRHTIGVSSEELARARKWFEDKNAVSTAIEPACDLNFSQLKIHTERISDNSTRQEKCDNTVKDNPIERLDTHEKQYENIPEKYMKNAINQQQSLQNKSVKDTTRDSVYHEPPDNIVIGKKLMETSYKDDNTIINEEYGISASSLYHQSNAQAKCNKFLAKKSKLKRANTIDIPNYLKLQAENLSNGNGGSCVTTLRRPINIGDKYTWNGGNVIPSFEPKTENDRKFLALINKNNESASITPSASLPFKSFNYRQIATVADKNWNNRFSNIKTTFDKPQINVDDENVSPRCGQEITKKLHCGEREIVVGSLRLPYNSGKKKSSGFSHAPTSPFQKIEKPSKDESTPGFLKPGYLSKNGSTLQAKVKMFDQENANTSVQANLTPLPTRSRFKQFNAKRESNLFLETEHNAVDKHEKSRSTENGNLNYHSFCKQFAPFATKNSADNYKSSAWSNNGLNNTTSNSHLDKKTREMFESREESTSKFVNDNRREVKVPVAYQAADRYENNERKGKSRNCKLYETYDAHVETNGNKRDIVAYPFEMNYQKPPNFGNKFHEVVDEKGDYEDTENIRRRSKSPSQSLSSLQYIKTAVLPTARNSSSPPRGQFSMQSVAVQTHQTDKPRSIYPNEKHTNFRSVPTAPMPKDWNVAGVSENLPDEKTRRIVSCDEPRNSITTTRHYPDTYQEQLSSERDNDLPHFVAHQSDYPVQGRQSQPQNTTTTTMTTTTTTTTTNSHACRPANYPTSTDYKSHYYPTVEHQRSYSFENNRAKTPPEIPIRANPPSKPASIRKNQNDNYEIYKKTYDDYENNDRIPDYPDYNETIFYRDNENPIYVSPTRDVERKKFVENSTNQLPGQILSAAIPYNPNEIYNPDDAISYGDDSIDISEDHSFTEDDNIQNQDISSSEGIVTRYACAIATVSPVPESPVISPLPPSMNEIQETRLSRIYDDAQSNERSRDHDIPYIVNPLYREERPRDSQDLSFEEIRRHNLLQQNLIRQLQGDQSTVPKVVRILSQEAPYREEISSSNMNYPLKLPEQEVSKVTRRSSQERLCRDEISSGNKNYRIKLPLEHEIPNVMRRLSKDRAHREEISSNYPIKLPEDQQKNPPDEPVIESNNTQEKINIFEGRNNSMKKHPQQFKPLSINRGCERDAFVTPKINIVSPSFKPSFRADKTRSGNNVTSKPPQKNQCGVDSSDEYLMSCASKPSRSIVLSKSESWHQLALSKSTLQVPQAQSSSLLKPPKPKSPSSLRLSKQYEASSSSDGIRKMEEKIQRYFTGSLSSVKPESPIPARRDPKTKRNLNSRKTPAPGPLMRSRTMPHIYDETSDVEKAFDSLFKEATNSENRY